MCGEEEIMFGSLPDCIVTPFCVFWGMEFIRLCNVYFFFFNFVATAFVSVVAGIKHNTHTGQWLTTFKATWHPQRDDVFVVGSMEQPRGVS
jgi:hypothetical protein